MGLKWGIKVHVQSIVSRYDGLDTIVHYIPNTPSSKLSGTRMDDSLLSKVKQSFVLKN